MGRSGASCVARTLERGRGRVGIVESDVFGDLLSRRLHFRGKVALWIHRRGLVEPAEGDLGA